MNEMNVRTGRILTLLAALLIATSATAFAAEESQSPATGHVLSAQEKAAEAQRLAKQAAALAKQAAALAAESQEASAPAVATEKATEKKQPASPTQQNWSSRDGAEVKISDANASASGNAGKANNWRGRQDAADGTIRFKNDKSDKSNSIASDKVAGDPASDRQSLSDANIRLVARMIADRDLRNANEQEPMPTPTPNSNNSNSGSKEYNSGGCNNGGCNGGNSCNSGCDMGCCNAAPCLFWTAGMEATFLSPNLNDEGATFDLVNTSTDRVDFSSTHGLDSLYVAPRIWLGVESCCWGVDMKYWQMRASSQGWDPAVGTNGEFDGPECGVPNIGHFSANSMSAYALDLEVSRRLCVRDCWMQFSGGIRHAEFRHDEFITGNAVDSISGDSSDGTDHVIGYARDDSFSQGTGFVLGWYGRRPVFPCSCVNWFYNLHYSVLWGPTNTAAETAMLLTLDDPGVAAGNAGSTNGARTHSDGTMTIGEVQVGLEWDYALQCLPANSFFRVALEYQRWDGGNGSSSSESFAGAAIDNSSTVATATASASAPEMNLFGFTLGTGLTW
jgi:hypothetical protein